MLSRHRGKRQSRALFSGSALLVALIGLSFFLIERAPAEAAAEVDLTQAVVVAPSSFSGPENKAVQMLIEEVEKRSQIRWRRDEQAPAGGVPFITVKRAASARGLAPEGYEIKSSGNTVAITGNDARGVLFGVGRLLRAMSI